MKDKEIELLKSQIAKLNVKNFELEAWKASTVILLERVFSANSQKIKQIENLSYDYTSWTLRDTSGISKSLEACKKLGAEILEASISELEDGSVIKETEQTFSNSIFSVLEEELKGKQIKKIKEILGSDSKNKEEDLQKFLLDIEKETLTSIISSVLLELKKHI